MLRAQRRVLVLSAIVAIFILLVIHLGFQPLRTEAVQSLIKNGAQYKLIGNSPSPSGTASQWPSSAIETHSRSQAAAPTTAPPGSVDKVIVVASVKSENTTWIDLNFPGWKIVKYIADDQSATFHTDRNKGNEANAYLTYIIQNYARLPEIVIFIHGHQKHKHGTRATFEGIDYDNVEAIKNLKIDFVRKTGYANLRCMSKPGCPAEIQPFRPEEERDPLRPQENAMAAAWFELFGNNNVPQVIATPCCAQFAVSRATILQRSQQQYESFLEWIYNTPLDNFTSGRIFEYLWHVIFGRDPVYCPDMEQCYWDQYGTTLTIPAQAQKNKTMAHKPAGNTTLANKTTVNKTIT